MVLIDGKVVPDYQVVDGLRVLACFSVEAIRETIRHKPKPGDIILATYPKCGTNWTQQIVLLLLNDAKPQGNASDFLGKCPYLEYTGVEALNSLPEPRLAKIHLPFDKAPYSPDAKYIFVVRNPKDCLVSFYHHSRTAMYDYVDGKFDDYFELFINGENDYGDYFDHVLSWYERRHDDNVLFLNYEDMKKDIKLHIIRIAKFLGPKYEALVDDSAKLSAIIEYSSFEYMKKHLNDDMTAFLDLCMNQDVDINSLTLPSGLQHIFGYLRDKRISRVSDLKFVRKGIVGDWRVNFTEDQNRSMNEKIENKMKGTELLDYWNCIGCI